MSKRALIVLCGFLALPAQAGIGAAAGEMGKAADWNRTKVCVKADLVRLSPTNPNDPLFPPSQWPKCTLPGGAEIVRGSL
jgi:hypothetical protein